MNKNTLCYLALGGNLGHPLALFDEAVQCFTQHQLAGHVIESPRYESVPVNASGPNYVNSVLEIQWFGTSDELLQTCQTLEAQLGRVRTTRNAPRTIDIDVLLIGIQTINTENLTVPHPRMHLRRFVLQPLLALNPDIWLPRLGFARDFLSKTLDQKVWLV